MNNHANNHTFLLMLVMGFVLAAFSIDAVVNGLFLVFTIEMLLAVLLIVGGHLLFPAQSGEDMSPKVYSNAETQVDNSGLNPLFKTVNLHGVSFSQAQDKSSEELMPTAIVVMVTHTHVILKTPNSEKLVSFELFLFPTEQRHTGERIAWPALDDLLCASGELSKLEAERVAQYETYMLQQHVG